MNTDVNYKELYLESLLVIKDLQKKVDGLEVAHVHAMKEAYDQKVEIEVLEDQVDVLEIKLRQYSVNDSIRRETEFLTTMRNSLNSERKELEKQKHALYRLRREMNKE